MTSSDGMASSGPHTDVNASPSHGGRPARRAARRGGVALSAALALMLPASPALAATTGTSGYKQEPPKPTTTTTPKSGTAPSKEATTPAATTPKAATEPATTTATPTPTQTTSPSESKLPFTGLNLTWVVGAGLLLLAAGLSLRVLQRRQRYDGR
ncbi:MAG TPA: hypothetical protein VMU32_07350 [Solirubrobacteraceae bacterium]|nr:hypothetical protein [Solirubrobacteraceae bacterium]